MINNTPESNSRLDNTVKETLTNYEASFDPNDWSRMESMLDAAPKPSSFKWSTVIGIAAVLIVIGGSYLLYNSLSSSKSIDKSDTTPVENVVKIIQKPIVVPKVTPPAISPAAVSEEVIKEIVEPDKIATTKEPVNKTVTNPTVASKEGKTKTKKEKTKVIKVSEETGNTQQVIGMGNEPVFGDMLDSSRGIVGETREKEETKKAAKAKKDLPVGWDNFMLKNVNPDSIKKHREKRDSIKAK